MPKFTFPNGELEISLRNVTVREFRRLFDPAQTLDEETATIAKAAGVSPDWLLDNLSQNDYKRLARSVVEANREPPDPN